MANILENTDSNSGSKQVISIDCLPDSILVDIFSRLQFVDLSSCSKVCHRWYLLSKDFSLKKKIIVRKDLKKHKQFTNLIRHHFTELLEEFQLLKESDRTALLPVKKHALWKLTQQSSNLKKLLLTSCSFASVSVKDLPSTVLHLGIRDSEVDPNVFFGVDPHLHLPHLTCLDIGGVSNFVTSQDLHVFSTLKCLRYLYLEGCFRINNGGIESMVDILPQLEILDVEGTDISNEGVHIILDNCKNIKELYVGHTSINDGAFSYVMENKVPLLSLLCIRRTNVCPSGMHVFLMHHVTNKKIYVKADFECTNKYLHLKTHITVKNEYLNGPWYPAWKCNHYLSHKCPEVRDS